MASICTPKKYSLTLKNKLMIIRMKRLTSLLIIAILTQPFYAQKGIYHMLVGTYTNTGKSQGIYSYKINMNTAAFTQESVETEVPDPSYLAITPDRKFVYPITENTDSSAAYAFSFDKYTGKLALINRSLQKAPALVLFLSPTSMYSQQIMEVEVFPFLDEKEMVR